MCVSEASRAEGFDRRSIQREVRAWLGIRRKDLSLGGFRGYGGVRERQVGGPGHEVDKISRRWFRNTVPASAVAIEAWLGANWGRGEEERSREEGGKLLL